MFCSDFTQSNNAAALILFTQFVNVDLYCGYQFQQASASNIHIEILDDTWWQTVTSISSFLIFIQLL